LACHNNQILGAFSTPTHRSSKGYTWCNGGAELGRHLSNEGGFMMISPTLKDITGFRNASFDVGHNNSG